MNLQNWAGNLAFGVEAGRAGTGVGDVDFQGQRESAVSRVVVEVGLREGAGTQRSVQGAGLIATAGDRVDVRIIETGMPRHRPDRPGGGAADGRSDDDLMRTSAQGEIGVAEEDLQRTSCAADIDAAQVHERNRRRAEACGHAEGPHTDTPQEGDTARQRADVSGTAVEDGNRRVDAIIQIQCRYGRRWRRTCYQGRTAQHHRETNCHHCPRHLHKPPMSY